MATSEITKQRVVPKSKRADKKTGVDAPRSLAFPKLQGSQQFRHLVSDLGGIHYVSKQFRMSEALVRSYLIGEIDPPYTVLLALYWHSHYGFSQAFSDAHWAHDYNSFLRHRAEEKVLYLERVVEHAVSLLERREGAAEAIRSLLSAQA